jgi:hypothetical protein
MAKRTLVFMILILTLLLSQSAQAADVPQPALNEIGRASCRERV